MRRPGRVERAALKRELRRALERLHGALLWMLLGAAMLAPVACGFWLGRWGAG